MSPVVAATVFEEGWVKEVDSCDEPSPQHQDEEDKEVQQAPEEEEEQIPEAMDALHDKLAKGEEVVIPAEAELEQQIKEPSWQEKHKKRVVFDESRNIIGETMHLGHTRDELRHQSTRYGKREVVKDSIVLMKEEKEAEEAQIKKVKAARRHTPTHNAADVGNVALLQEIYQNCGKAALLAPNQFGRTPVDFAASGGHLDALQFLYEAVPECFTTTDDQGWNAAHVAAVHGHAEVLRYLHAVEPDLLTAVDKANRVPADYGAQQGYEWVHVVLAELGADIPVPKKKGYNPEND